mmetsp:Transcript_4975/g.12859  ORF Transcript_4975/g.12859 Transcript_4975/m.12859 type:complete len:233 (+) Transcript_4975:617-1315(+)
MVFSSTEERISSESSSSRNLEQPSQKAITCSRERMPVVCSGGPPSMSEGLKRRSAISRGVGLDTSIVAAAPSCSSIFAILRKAANVLPSSLASASVDLAAAAFCARIGSLRSCPTAKSCSSPTLSRYSRCQRIRMESAPWPVVRIVFISSGLSSGSATIDSVLSIRSRRRASVSSPSRCRLAAGWNLRALGSELARCIALCWATCEACWQFCMKEFKTLKICSSPGKRVCST